MVSGGPAKWGAGVRARVCTLVVLAWAFSAGASAALEVLTPPPFAAVSGDHINLVGRSDATRLLLCRAGCPDTVLNVQTGLFHVRVPLRFGFNELHLTTDSGDSAWLIVLRQTGSAGRRRSQTRYPPYLFHGNDIGSTCADCHTLAPFAAADRPAPDTSCRSCHPPERVWIEPHVPAAQDQCSICHGDEVIPLASPLDHAGLCQSCHEGKIEEFNKEFQHGPVGAGSCLACHNPHGSVYPFGLRKPMEELCTSCHEQVEEKAVGMLLHDPFRDGDCTGCHDPHATNNAWSLSHRSNAVCAPCHLLDSVAVWHAHPISGKLRAKKKIVELNERGELECTSCHEAHYGESDHLLRSKGPLTCRGCHDDK